MLGEDDDCELQEKVQDIIEALFPSEAYGDAALSYNEFVKDNVAPLISHLSPMASVSDVIETVERELEKRFGCTVSVSYEDGAWEMLLEKIGEEAELFLDEEEDEEDEEDIILSDDSHSESESEHRPFQSTK